MRSHDCNFLSRRSIFTDLRFPQGAPSIPYCSSCVPGERARKRTSNVRIPTIGNLRSSSRKTPVPKKKTKKKQQDVPIHFRKRK